MVLPFYPKVYGREQPNSCAKNETLGWILLDVLLAKYDRGYKTHIICLFHFRFELWFAMKKEFLQFVIEFFDFRLFININKFAYNRKTFMQICWFIRFNVSPLHEHTISSIGRAIWFCSPSFALHSNRKWAKFHL